MKLISTLILLLSLTVACSSENSDEKNNDAAAENELNIDPKSEFPSTILYTGAEQPQDSSQILNTETAPEGMVAIDGGNVRIGSNEGFDHERPLFWARLKPFFMDKSPVTVGEFRKFVEDTGYKTDADKFGNAGIIHETTNKTWILKDGANWEYPMGHDFPKAKDDHPVTQVSWRDAEAYAKWAGKRLPHEIEWEHAARNGHNSRNIYPWGDNLEPDGKFRANVWNGIFPEHNEVSDGFPETSPVGYYGQTPIGLTDMSGNVWEWCSNHHFDYRTLAIPNFPKKVDQEMSERGGSFLCEPTWCHGYRVSGRSSSTSETSLFHVGFRCVKDIE
ncbi:formylglycine-generating enzyme family protein [Marinilongibacter aquaticus]|uniref:formylglycine-generating enzyme family protein n=1 Tax=Marinilongibacter aquaticus TaxID=2975157 RepID=UPI0021BDB7CB|nr:formylglycine-generating enzyme family protein [Marinilongibacter aquaticus]UBM60685.1 formylglycine-generating enzyme family protein [Marinilongibacter aquaticus]